MIRCSALVAVLGASACNPPIPTPGEFDLDVTVPASYAIAHPGQQFAMALVEGGPDGANLEIKQGLMPSSGDSNVFFAELVEEGVDYELHFWIDANDGGGSAGLCDGAPDFFDHQWLYQAGAFTDDATFTLPEHNTDFQDVCGTTADP